MDRLALGVRGAEAVPVAERGLAIHRELFAGVALVLERPAGLVWLLQLLGPAGAIPGSGGKGAEDDRGRV
eukprot:440850-Pyramimonas_sp.AAC.1